MSIRNGINFPNDATHSPPTKSNKDKSVVPLEQRPGGVDHPDYVAPPPEPPPVPYVRGVSADKPHANVYEPLKKREKQQPAPKPKKDRDAPLEVRMERAFVEPPPLPPPPEPYERGDEKPKISVYHPSQPASKKPPTHLPHTPSNKDKTVVPLEQRRGYVEPVIEPKPEIERGLTQKKQPYDYPLPPKQKKRSRIAVKKKSQELPIEYRAGGQLHPDTLNPPPPPPEPKKWERGTDTSGKTKNSTDHSHQAVRKVPASQPVPKSNNAGKRFMPGLPDSPPPPPPTPPQPPTPRGREHQKEAWRYGGRTDPTPPAGPLSFNQWLKEKYPVITLLDDLSQLLLNQRFRGQPWGQLCMADPSALTAEGLTILGKTYVISDGTRKRIEAVCGAKLIETPWNEPRDYLAWRNEKMTEYETYLDGEQNNE